MCPHLTRQTLPIHVHVQMSHRTWRTTIVEKISIDLHPPINDATLQAKGGNKQAPSFVILLHSLSCTTSSPPTCVPSLSPCSLRLPALGSSQTEGSITQGFFPSSPPRAPWSSRGLWLAAARPHLHLVPINIIQWHGDCYDDVVEISESSVGFSAS